LPHKVRLKPAGIFLPIQPDPDLKDYRERRAASNPTHPARDAHRPLEVELLTIRPGEGGRVRARVRDESIENHSSRVACQAKLGAELRQSFAQIAWVVGEGGSAHAGGLIFMADAGKEGMPPRLHCGVEYVYRDHAGRDDSTVGEADPFSPVLRQQAVADS